MSATNLTIGGFTQSGVAKSLIEKPSNSEKGLTPRIIWLFPCPLYEKFSSLGEIDSSFVENISKWL